MEWIDLSQGRGRLLSQGRGRLLSQSRGRLLSHENAVINLRVL